MEPFNRVVVTIRGIKYPITTREDPSYAVVLAHKLDEALKELTQGAGAVSLNEALVLVAMSYIDSTEKAEKNCDSLRAQISEYLEEAAKSRHEAAEARRELQKLEKRLAGSR
jgi:cell division protein ZapA (FtsZ GTPase activity inhibitor)